MTGRVRSLDEQIQEIMKSGLVRLEGTESGLVVFRLSDVWAYSMDPANACVAWEIYLPGQSVLRFRSYLHNIPLQCLLEDWLQENRNHLGEPIPEKKGARK